MLEEKIPKNKYLLADYANLEERAQDGSMCIPLLWGSKTNITPVCIDTAAYTFKLTNREIKSIDAVRVDGVADTQYTEDLPNAEFTFINLPFLNASMTYYLVLEGTFAIDGVNYLEILGDPAGTAAPGARFDIDGGGNWSNKTPDAMYFEVWGKDTLDDTEEKKVDYPMSGIFGTWTDNNFRDAAARTKVAQAFVTPAGAGFYVTKILLSFHSQGNPSGDIRVYIVSAYLPAEVQVGCKGIYVSALFFGLYSDGYLHFRQIVPNNSRISVDASGVKNPDTSLMTNVADIIQDIYINILGGDVSDLNAADFAALKAARTEDLGIWIDRETTFREVIEKMEAGQLFKFLPNLAGEYTVQYYQSGEPAGTPHYRDEDFISFESFRNLSSVYYKCQVKYDEDPTDQTWKVEEETSEIARFFYRSKRTLEIETYLVDQADAVQLAEDYLGTDGASTRRQHMQYPQRGIKIELQKRLGFDLIPTQKIKITRIRGDHTAGTYSGVLFRILSIERNHSTQTVSIMAVLDELTY